MTGTLAKITRPRMPEILPRERLFRLLDTARRRPLIWVSAPPGAGKTTLVASWTEARELPALWYRLDAGDGDPATFFYYLGLAARQAAPRYRKPLPIFTPEYQFGLPIFSKRFFEVLSGRLKPPTVIVFDNYHEVPPDSPFHGALRAGLEAVPPGVTVVLISREAPVAAMAGLKAAGGMAALGWEDLRLTLDESEGLAGLCERGGLDPDALRLYHDTAAGWAAGLILLLAGGGAGSAGGIPRSESPLQDIFDYFAGELFDRADHEMRRFLLATAFLPSMTAAMAESISGVTASGKFLPYLSRNNYFTEVHAKETPVYRYHPLFREFLLARAQGALSAGELNRLQRAAAALLAEEGQTEDAAALLRVAGDWEGLTGIILGQAQTLMAQGRSQTLLEWLTAVPAEMRETVPWLCYWLGTCQQLSEPSESRHHFERAFQSFLAEGDMAGTYFSWAGAVDTFLYEWDDFTPLNRWIERLEELGLDFPSPDIEARVSVAMTGALVLSRPHHPDIGEWTERAYRLSRLSPDGHLRLQACLYAFNYYLWTGDIARSGMIADEMRKISSSPAHGITHLVTEALYCNWSAADSGQATHLVEKGLETADISGIHLWDHFLYAQRVYAALNTDDTDTAGVYLRKMEQVPQCARGLGLWSFNGLSCWYYLVLGKPSRAVAHGKAALGFFAGSGSFGEMLSRIQMAQALQMAGEHDQATACLAGVHGLIQQSKALMLEYMYLLTEAQFALDRCDEATGVAYLHRGMALGRNQGYVTMFWWWLSPVMTRLCLKSLEAGIEVDYVRSLIRRRGLYPAVPPVHLEEWPWPLRITTLGRFELLRDDEPVIFTGKVQQKPLSLLKALIALGGTDVPAELLTDLLWPDVEGNQAAKSFEVNLLRLRRLLGSEHFLLLREGRLSLNGRSCNVDVWALERLMAEGEALRRDGSPGEAERLVARVIRLYRGHFLAADLDLPWAISPRERLRSAFLHFIEKMGDFLESRGELDLAIDCYLKGLEVDDLAEEFYQGLMACYAKLDRPAKAIDAYNRCRIVLAARLDITPSPKTGALYRRLREGTPLPVNLFS
ncbi:MAG TPA: BTAD domain-containing putative transcriptional regulator [Desulfuromonadaceae bacterium]